MWEAYHESGAAHSIFSYVALFGFVGYYKNRR